MKKLFLTSVMSAVMMAGGVASAKAPPTNVSAKHHPNIAAAQALVVKAYEKVVAAQKANEWDLGGHAQKAKELLDQVNAELKLAAETANAK